MKKSSNGKESHKKYEMLCKNAKEILDSFFLVGSVKEKVFDLFQRFEEKYEEFLHDSYNISERDNIDIFNLWLEIIRCLKNYFSSPKIKRIEEFIILKTDEIYIISKDYSDKNQQFKRVFQSIKSQIDGITKSVANDIEETNNRLNLLHNTITKTMFDEDTFKKLVFNIINAMQCAITDYQNGNELSNQYLKKLDSFTKLLKQTLSISDPRKYGNDSQGKDSSEMYEETKLQKSVCEVQNELKKLKNIKENFSRDKFGISVLHKRDELEQRRVNIEMSIANKSEKLKELQIQLHEYEINDRIIKEKEDGMLNDSQLYNAYLKQAKQNLINYNASISSANQGISAIIQEIKSIVNGKEPSGVKFEINKINDLIKKVDTSITSNDSELSNANLKFSKLNDHDKMKVKYEGLLARICDYQSYVENLQKIISRDKNNVDELRCKYQKNVPIDIYQTLVQEVQKWEEKIKHLEKEEETPKDSPPKVNLIQRNEFDKNQDLLDQRSNALTSYYEAKSSSASSDELSSIKELYYQIDAKIKDTGHHELYDKLYRHTDELQRIYECYEKSIKEEYNLWEANIDNDFDAANLETIILLKKRDFVIDNIDINVDQRKIDEIRQLYYDKLSLCVKLKKIYDWIDDTFDDQSIKAKTNYTEKLDFIMKLVE